MRADRAMRRDVVRIGGACGAYGDSTLAVPQLLREPELDYLVLDYLSEPVMAMFAKLAASQPDAGYPPDFLSVHVGPHLEEIALRRIKVISNAGAMRPRKLAAAIEKFAAELGLSIRVAAIDGDDLVPRLSELAGSSIREMFSGRMLPDGDITSCNVYFGAFPIAAALKSGADIVVTGRVVDSALALGALIHEFGWGPRDYDLLAAGTVAGHLLECGAQVSGGTFTDWRDVPNWAEAGFPIGECRRDGSVVITKPSGSGGLVSRGTVAEQLLYEVGDPQAYFVPDVTCDFSTVEVREMGPDRVQVSGAKGYPPTATYKACLSYDDGWRAVVYLPIISIEAVAKAEREASAILAKTATMLREHNLGPWAKTCVEILGGETSFGAHARARDAREVMLRIAVEHDEKAAIDLFARESPCSVMSMSAGSTVGIVQSNPVSRLFMFLVPKGEATPILTLDTRSEMLPDLAGSFREDMIVRPNGSELPAGAPPMTSVPLIDLAWARSGDKGNLFNVAVIARETEFLPYIRSALTQANVADWYAHLFENGKPGRVDRYDVPGVHALNFVVHDSLDGGSTSSARLDFVAKGMAQQLLEYPVKVPAELASRLDRAPLDARPYSGPA